MASHKLPPIDFLARGLAMARRLLEDPHLQFSTIGERPSIIKKITDCLPPGFLQGGLTIYARIEKVQTTIQYERSEAFLLQVINLETRGVEKSDVIRILESVSSTPYLCAHTYSFRILDQTDREAFLNAPYEQTGEDLDISLTLSIKETRSGLPYVTVICNTRSSRVEELKFSQVARFANRVAARIYEEIEKVKAQGPDRLPPPVFS